MAAIPASINVPVWKLPSMNLPPSLATTETTIISTPSSPASCPLLNRIEFIDRSPESANATPPKCTGQQRLHVAALELRTHETALAVAERTGFSIYDSLIVAAALHAGSRTLYAEDLQHGQVIDKTLTIVDPFRNLSARSGR